MNISHVYINGMTCGHCASKVEKALKNIPQVQEVTVSLAKKQAIVESNELLDPSVIKDAVVASGYEFLRIE